MTENNDIFISHLQRHLEILDAEIAAISEKISESNDPEGDGYYDSSEYFMGAGFVAVQKYMTETLCFLNVEQMKALELGPKLSGDISFASLVWSAANCWKHDAEWWKGAVAIDTADSDGMNRVNISWPEDRKSKSSVKHLKNFGRFGHDYICSIVLAKLVDRADEIRLQSVLPYLKTWRNDVEQLDRI
ncbi:hypothetical protein [Pseudotabrizicola alkalilacus]|uniref:hypothetical protein n=1 Tax=Pseudotabrizicola alkalilacus TaxID=2305252 RepID=UPI0011C18F78|nr:hypothetical protein [Pseudotabrizicola alkalilacus]